MSDRSGVAQQAAPDKQPPAWGGRLFLGRGWILYMGMGGPAATHRHHTTQLVVSRDGDVDLDVNGESRRAPVALIPRNAEHALNAAGARLALLLVEPMGPRGAALDLSARELPVGEIQQLLAEVPVPLASASLAEATAWTDNLFDAFGCPKLPPAADHPGVRQSLAYLGANTSESLTLSEAARRARLSPSRLTHLFSEQVGIPFRRYVLWLRIRRAAELALRGNSLTDAAYSAGFSDQAHLSRTFRRMFGLRPSDVLRRVELVSTDWPERAE